MNPWAVLGLPPGSDRDAIRRAYARLLKGVNPEDDPEGFMALRAAHDAALNQLKWRQQWPDDDAADAGDDGTADPADGADAAGPPAWQPQFQGSAPPSPAPEPAALDPAAQALAAEREADLADLGRRQQALVAVIDAGGDQAAQHDALDQLLAAPALIDILARDRIELWVAAVLAHRLPASDPVVVHAIECFGWAELPLGQRNPDVERLLRRREEGAFVVNIARRHTPLHLGYVALSTPPGPRWWRHLKALFSAEPAQTRQLLGLIDGPLPGMADWLNADAIAAWRDYHDKPRLRLWMIFTMIPLASVILVTALADAGWSEPAEAAVSLLAWASPWGLVWLLRRRLVWQADWDRPDWHYAAWPLAVLALPLLAALWPSVPLVQPLFLVPLLLALGWTLLATDSVQPAGWGDLAPGLVRSLPAWLVLILLVGGAPARAELNTERMLALFGCTVAWWQAGDQISWAARRVLARHGGRFDDRAGGPWAPWLVLAAGAVVALLALGLAAIDAGLVGRALALMPLPLLAALVALRMTSGWHQIGPLLGLAAVLLLAAQLVSLLDPGAAGAGGLMAGIADWGLTDPATGKPRPGVLFVVALGIMSAWSAWRPGRAGGGRWLIGFLLLIVVLGGVARQFEDRPPATTKPAPTGQFQPARPDGSTRDWVDVDAMQPPPPVGKYEYEAKLAVGPQGRVLLCTMSRSTGVATLDRALCQQIKERARFRPGRNDKGEPMASIEFFGGWVRRAAAPAPAPAPPPPPPIRCPDSKVSGPMVAEPCMADRWFHDGSYPAAALAAGHSGTVHYALEVGTDGRVQSCTIETSSGHASLDRGTCSLLKARARFVPAQDVDGSPMPWTYRGAISWELRSR